VGTISNTGLFVSSGAAGQQTATITATSAADSTKTASATVAINPAPTVTISISPQTGSVTAGQSLQFSANVGGNSNQQVAWTVAPASVGTVSNTGLFAASSTAGQQTAIVTATSAADSTKTASATVTINPLPTVAVSISPQVSSVAPGQSIQFNAAITGSSDQRISWTISPFGTGTISSSGYYTAPTNVTSPQTVTIQATSVIDSTKSATATVTINPSSRVTVTITPGSGVVAAGQSIQFFSTVTGTANQEVYWVVSPAGTGTISNNGYYTAPASITSQQVIQVKATSVTDPASTTVATLTINPPAPVGVTLTPANGAIFAGESLQFYVSVSGTSNQEVYWRVTPDGTGTISNNGLYTAPANITSQKVITISATSVTDAGKSASATVFINPR